MNQYTPINYGAASQYVEPTLDNPYLPQNQQNTNNQFDLMAFQQRLNEILGMNGGQPQFPQQNAVQPNQVSQAPMYMPQQYVAGRGVAATPLESSAAIQGSDAFNNAASGYGDRFGSYLKNKFGDYAGNAAQAGLTGVGYALGGPFGALLGGFIGKDVNDKVKSTIQNPTANDPYAPYRSNNRQYDTVSGNEGMSVADQYAAYGAGQQGLTNPDSNANYQTPSGNEGMSVADQYGAYGAGQQAGNNGSFVSPTSDSYSNYSPDSYSGYTTGSSGNRGNTSTDHGVKGNSVDARGGY